MSSVRFSVMFVTVMEMLKLPFLRELFELKIYLITVLSDAL